MENFVTCTYVGHQEERYPLISLQERKDKEIFTLRASRKHQYYYYYYHYLIIF